MILNISLAFVVLALGFVLGIELTMHFVRREERHVTQALQHQYDRLRSGIDADDPIQPYSRKIDGQAADWLGRKEA